MGANSKIEWTDHTFNPWRGCTKVSDGCKNCYAEKMSHRNPAVLGEWGPGAKRVVASEAYWRQPLRWNHKAILDGVRRRVFCASLADVFDEEVPNVPGRVRLFDTIAATPALDWLILTKRPENALAFAQERALPENVWLGATVENQQSLGRVATILQIPATVHFVSAEPLLGPVDLWHWLFAAPRLGTLPALDWVIAGGESGPNARPMHPDWARSLRDQCQAVGVPFFFKQWGGPGLKKGGCLLDGREWKEFPMTPTHPLQGEEGEKELTV